VPRLAVLVLSDPIVSELREKLTDKFALPSVEVDAIIDRLTTHAEHVPVQGRSGWVQRDPDDGNRVSRSSWFFCWSAIESVTAPRPSHEPWIAGVATVAQTNGPTFRRRAVSC
jgi:hypothetical protein